VVRWFLTSVYRDNLRAYLDGFRRALDEGGTASSKTWSILQILILIAQNTPESLLISVVSETLPHLKKGAITDFFNILNETQDNNFRYNKTEHRYTFGKGVIEFFGADEADKVRGPRRDILFINEANNVLWEAARGLDVRTRLFTFCDWNPVAEFWAHENWLERNKSGEFIGTQDNALIRSTYRDALEVVTPGEITTILKTGERDPNWANIYIEGKLGKVEGLVYPYFEQETELPRGDYFYGLDFGFSTDVTAVARHVIIESALHSQELIYEKGMTNDMIAERMAELGVRKGYDEIFADAAEPKSIEEIKRYGFNIKPAPKGSGSVEFGHQKVRQYKHYWTKDSLNGIKEQRNYRYIADKDGKLTDKTTHTFSHLMDERRYAVIGKLDEQGYAFDL
jgi:phage terminase large subunit